MTAVLQEIRRLEAAQERGEIDASDMQRLRDALTDLVEDADEIDPDTDLAPPPHLSGPLPDLWQICLLVIAGFTLLTLFGTWVIGDIWIAITLSVTLLAALTIRAFHNLDRDNATSHPFNDLLPEQALRPEDQKD